MKKRFLALFLCVLMTVSLLAVTAGAADGKHLNVGWHSKLETLDNLTASSWEPNRLGIVETLTRISPDYELIPWLAESWEHTEDTTWVFHLREGVKFSNGKACDAEAVKASLMRTAETSRSKNLLNIASIDADGLDVTIHTNAVNAALPNNLVDYIAVIWDVDSMEDLEKGLPVGTGPFALTSWDRTGKLELKANKDYWGGTPKLDTVTVTVINDGNAQAMALDNGEVDLCFQLPTENVRQFVGNDAFVINKEVGSRSQLVFFNLENEFLKDLAVRKAITMAIDREVFANVINKGDSAAATGIFPAGFSFGKVEGIAPDLEGAKKVLADAGYTLKGKNLQKDGKDVTLRIITYGSHGALLPTFAEAMQDVLKELGIQTDISLNDYSVHTDLLSSGDFDIALNSYIMAAAMDPQSFADELFRTGGSYNYGKYSNAEVDKLVEALDAEFDPAKRVELALQMQDLIVADCPWLCLGHLAFQVVGNAKVTGYETQATELYLLTKDTDIK